MQPMGLFAFIRASHLMNSLAMGLDHLFFPGFRSSKIDRPIFILGNPRSGTTFLHRFLLNTDQLCAFELWEMLFPSITARKTLARFVDRMAPVSPARYHSSDAHETGMRDVETDDAMAFFHLMDGPFFWTYFLAWEDTWGSGISRRTFDLEGESARDADRMFGCLERCWRRNLVLKHKPRVIVKSSIFTVASKTLLRRYPDCKIVYMVRDPVESIPSGMSLITGVLERAFDMFHSTRKQDRERYLENLYQAACHLYRAFHEVKRENAIPARHLMIVPYPRIMQDFRATISELLDFLELEPGPAFEEKVRVQAQKQKQYRSEHKYYLEKFGLSEERIRDDLAFVYRDYQVK
jgi:hypothetical protein